MPQLLDEIGVGPISAAQLYCSWLRAAQIPRSSIVLGRLIAEFFKAVLIAVAIVLLGVVFGIEIASGVLRFVLLVLLTATWAVVFVGFMQIIATKTRSAAATNWAGLIFSRCCS